MTRLYLQLTDIYLQKLIDKDVFCYSVKSCALNWTVCTVMAEILWSVLEIMYRSIAKPPIPPVGKPRDLWLFLKNFGHIPRYVASLDGQMPTRLSFIAKVIMLWLWRNPLFSLLPKTGVLPDWLCWLLYVTGEFHRFLHRGRAKLLQIISSKSTCYFHFPKICWFC